jgi:cytoskeletal protein CcmA (bactofilin family)
MVFGPGKKGEKKSRDFTAFQYEEVTTGEPSGSFIGKTMKIKGRIVADEDLTVEGEVKGNVKVNKTLTIGRSGNVNADIKANVIEIFGLARGNITASEKVAIMSDGRYNGNLQSKKLVVEEGAVLIGDINKELETEKPTPKTRKKTPPSETETEAKKVERPEEKKEPVPGDSREPNESEELEEPGDSNTSGSR